MLEQIVAALGLGVAHACTAFRTVAVLLHGLLAGLVAVLALRLAFGNKLAACVLVLELGLDNVLLVTIAIVLALAAAAGLVAAAFLAPLFLPLRGLPTGCDLSRLQPSTRSARSPTSSSTSGESWVTSIILVLMPAWFSKRRVSRRCSAARG